MDLHTYFTNILYVYFRLNLRCCSFQNWWPVFLRPAFSFDLIISSVSIKDVPWLKNLRGALGFIPDSRIQSLVEESRDSSNFTMVSTQRSSFTTTALAHSTQTAILCFMFQCVGNCRIVKLCQLSIFPLIVKPKSEVPKSKVPKSRPKGLGLTLKSHGPPTYPFAHGSFHPPITFKHAGVPWQKVLLVSGSERPPWLIQP